IMDPYVPPEGDARLTSLSKDGVKQQMQKLRQTAASQLAYVPLIKLISLIPCLIPRSPRPSEVFLGFPGDFSHSWVVSSLLFPLLLFPFPRNLSFNKQKLHSLVTERCYPDMVRGNRYRTIHWRFLESLEPPRVVHVRCESIMNKGNLYGQVTVRMHSRQILAIYDRFGRLMCGGEEIPKDVLEYVVFERYLVNPHGAWRMHGKIIPEWAPPRDPILKTVMIPGPALDPSQEHQ
ncbi:RM45 protein, partial [Erpornis zantholeuca]|nr:RM45 protein [Erpornis zantholeuca]